MRVLTVAEYVIRRAIDKEVPITNLKLQKTLYYVQGYFLRCFSEPAFDEDIRNWQYGPVSPTAYFAYSSYGARHLEQNDQVQVESMSKKMVTLFNMVVDACLNYTARSLVQMTHEESPWKETKLNDEISQDVIQRYFLSHNPLNIRWDVDGC